MRLPRPAHPPPGPRPCRRTSTHALVAALSLALLATAGACKDDAPVTGEPDLPVVDRDVDDLDGPPTADAGDTDVPDVPDDLRPDAADLTDTADAGDDPDPADLLADPDADDLAGADLLDDLAADVSDVAEDSETGPDCGADSGGPDCGEACGNGFVDSPDETCDLAIAPGEAGACPQTCPSEDACLVRELVAPGTCNAACSDTFITTPGPDDGCCPFEANANNDPDCEPLCGNGIVEEGEDCDEGLALPTNDCNAFCHFDAEAATAFHLDALDLLAPHLFADAGGFGCIDITATVNGLLGDAVTGDGDGDGFIDLSVLVVFDPLAPSAPSGELDVALGLCTPGLEPTCTLDPDTPVQTVAYTNLAPGGGTCLAPEAGTFDPDYTPPVTAITAAEAPCFVTEAFSVTLEFAGVSLPLEDAVLAANYAGPSAARLEPGLLRGFLSEAAAQAVTLPADLPFVGGAPLSTVLPGATDCDDRDDRVTDGPPDDATTGWWLYLDFGARRADLIE